MKPESLRAFLRDGTSDLHATLDAHVAERGYLGSLAGYRDFLLRSLAFQSGAERALDAMHAEDWIIDWAERRRTRLLLDDLRVLNCGIEAAERAFAAGAQVTQALTGDATRERVFGVAYVLEGSTLGATMVLRMLEPLQLTPEHGASFLAGGRLPPQRWSTFLALLEAQDSPAFDRQAALEAARATFSAARRELG